MPSNAIHRAIWLLALLFSEYCLNIWRRAVLVLCYVPCRIAPSWVAMTATMPPPPTTTITESSAISSKQILCLQMKEWWKMSDDDGGGGNDDGGDSASTTLSLVTALHHFFVRPKELIRCCTVPHSLTPFLFRSNLLLFVCCRCRYYQHHRRRLFAVAIESNQHWSK